MVYDCFSFFNELDLLEIRLNILSQSVDKFVLVEADRTHSNKPKPFYFEENKERYKEFLPKIIHIKLHEYPEYKTAWTYENHQRNMILEGLKACSPDDVILISDLDEIPNPEIIKNYQKDGMYRLEQRKHSCFLNYKSVVLHKWYGTNILCYRDIIDDAAKEHVFYFSDTCLKELNQGTTPTKIRMLKKLPIKKNAGWHFTYLGGIENIKKKLASFAHQEFNNVNYKNDEYIEKCITERRDFFYPYDRYIITKFDKSYPDYLSNNSQNYTHLVLERKSSDSLRNIWIQISGTLVYHCFIKPRKKFRGFRKRLNY